MAKMKKHALKSNFVQVPNETAKAVENEISLQALGLIVNLWSYNVEVWDLHKTELYKRYVKNKEASVKTAWNELIEARYIVEYKYRVGKKWDYDYHYRIEPFTPQEVMEIRQEAVEEHGQIWGLDFQDLKMETSNCSPQNQEIINTISKKEKEKKDKSKQNNKTLETSNDILDFCNSLYIKYSSGRWSKKQWNTLIGKFIEETNWNEVKHIKAYCITAIEKMAYKHDYKNGLIDIEDKFSFDGQTVPFYNWLEEE